MTNLLIIVAIHLSALSQIESGDNDSAVGASGEITRYQIAPAVWEHQLSAFPHMASKHQDKMLSRMVAFEIWSHRLDDFQKVKNRNPSLEELYLLWHRPARVLCPHPRERERSERFASLVLALARGGSK